MISSSRRSSAAQSSARRTGSSGSPSSNRPGVQDARVHDARHTAATLLIEQGVHIQVGQKVLGHTTTTERYTHVATLQMKDASNRMDQALWGTP
ncbi:tyrosine-type recombinase/integrase [Nonomuraea rubra]